MADIDWEENLAKVANRPTSVHAYLALLDGDKQAVLADINKNCQTKYKINHLDNWLAGRVGTPVTAERICRVRVLHRSLPDDLVEKLRYVF